MLIQLSLRHSGQRVLIGIESVDKCLAPLVRQVVSICSEIVGNDVVHRCPLGLVESKLAKGVGVVRPQLPGDGPAFTHL